VTQGVIKRARGSDCAPVEGDGPANFGPARTSREFPGIPIPCGWVRTATTLAFAGLIALLYGDARRPDPRMHLVRGKPGASCLAFALSPNGKMIATTRTDGRFSLRDILGVERTLETRGRGWWAVDFSPDGRLLAVGWEEPGILIHDLATGKSRNLMNGQVSRPWALAFSPDGRFLAGSKSDADGEILLWEVGTGRICARLRGRFPARDLAFSPDGALLAAGERDERRVTLWNLQTGNGRSIFGESSTGATTSVAFSPDGSLLAAAGPAERIVRLWEMPSGRLRLRIAGHAGGTTAVRFSPAGGLLVTSGCDGMVRIWKVETGEPVVVLAGRSSMLRSLRVSADGRTIAAVALDDDVRLWDLEDVLSVLDQKLEPIVRRLWGGAALSSCTLLRTSEPSSSRAFHFVQRSPNGNGKKSGGNLVKVDGALCRDENSFSQAARDAPRANYCR
jgi:WD40 repeat protein